MNINDCCNLPSDSNESKILLSQILREVKELSTTTEAKLLLHDGKIAELCIYVKNNLSNTIRTLLDTMQNSGELNDIITTTILSEIELLQAAVYPEGHIKRYNPCGDGVHDDSTALSMAVEAAKAHNKPLIIDEGKYLIQSNINAKFIKNIDINGEIVTANDSILEVGGSSSDGSGYNIKIKKAKNIKVSGLKNSLINIDYCDKLHLFADGEDSTISSLAYCQFYGAYCKELIIEGVGNTNLAWINENVFRIKRIESITIKGDYEHNNNHFEHINFEKGVLNLDGARNNYISARCEGGISIFSTDRAQANFIEKEYYYRHYFGDDASEDKNGTFSFYPVNKLQSERQLLRIDKYNRNFPVGSLKFNQDGTFLGNNYNEIFHSNLIPITNTFALKLKSDTKNFRIQLKFYDANKNQIADQVTNYADGKISFVEGAEWNYTIASNIDNDSVMFFPGTARYVEYRVIFGNNSTFNIEYVTVKLVKYTGTDINITNTLHPNIYTSVPADGYWERGTILYAKNPVAGNNIGIVCVESGTPGVWKNWGKVTE